MPALHAMSIAMCITAWVVAGCDSGLSPPDEGPDGAITGTIEYRGAWPPPEAVVDLRFVALRFIPEDTTDFLQLNRMEVSPTLRYGVVADTFFIAGVAPGVFPFSGVARQATPDIFSWRPIGLYEEADGVVEVVGGMTARLHVVVDFDNPPDFP